MLSLSVCYFGVTSSGNHTVGESKLILFLSSNWQVARLKPITCTNIQQSAYSSLVLLFPIAHFLKIACRPVFKAMANGFVSIGKMT